MSAGDVVENKTSRDVTLKDYPLEVFPNWNILAREKYYVAAPVDKLGEWSFHLRTHLTSLILAGNPAIQFLQSMNSPTTTRIAYLFSKMGLEEFFFSLIVVLMWLIDARLGRLLAALLAVGFMVCGSLKVALCLPHPPIPPALLLSEENRDWAWPSNHALLGTAYPWFIWMYASQHYDVPLWGSLLLLATTFIWNCGVSWSRIYLGVHSPCDVLGGWTIGVLILFIFGGFSDRLHDAFELASESNISFYIYLYSATMICLWIHPRSWPETQSYGEVVSVLSGAAAIWSGRIFHLGGRLPFKSLLETTPDAPWHHYPARFLLGCVVILIARTVAKALCKLLVKMAYKMADLPFYSYSEMCKNLGDMQPTKRYTSRMRFRPIAGQKVMSLDDTPYDVDLPVKFFVYGLVGFMVGEGCPALFAHLNI